MPNFSIIGPIDIVPMAPIIDDNNTIKEEAESISVTLRRSLMWLTINGYKVNKKPPKPTDEIKNQY